MHTSPRDAYGLRPDGQDPPGTGRNRMPRLRGKRLCAALSTMALAATGAGLAPPASATITGTGVRAGSNITVFHNIDFVAVFGYGAGGENILVEVLRNGVVIGSESGIPVDLEGLPGIEVNHGPEGPPQDGDCWEGHTPDIRPGDVIHVTDAGGTDEVTVDNITFTGEAFEENPVAGENHDILMKGVAKFADGTNIPLERLDSAEFLDTSKFRGAPDAVEVDPLVDGGFIMRYHPPYNLVGGRNVDGLDEAQRKASLLTSGGHGMGFGHVDPLPLESMLVDGIHDTPGPALGCEGSVAAVDAVTSLSDSMLNQADVSTGNLTVSGVSFDATDVAVTVGSLAPVDATITGAAGGPQTWTANVPMADIGTTVPDGNVTVSMAATRTAGGPIAGLSKTLVKDTVGPALAPSASPAPRAEQYVDTQNVALTAGPGETIRYTLDGADPTSTTGNEYSVSFAVNPGTSTLKALAVDEAGNAGPIVSGSYTVVASTKPAAPTAVSADERNASSMVTWTPSTDTGLVDLTGFTITATSSNGGAPVTVNVSNPLARSELVTDLTNGKTYTIKVAAKNQAPGGIAREGLSTESAPITPATVADRPTIGVASAGRGLARVQWTEASENGGADVTGYKLRVYRGASLAKTMVLGNVTGTTVRNLVNGATYRFSVMAVNRKGDSAQSARSNAVRPQTIASSPRRVRALANAAGGRVTGTAAWLAPSSTGGARITSYVVRAAKVRANGSLARANVVAIRPAGARAATVNLRAGTYRFQVRAVNAVGNGPYSAFSNARRAR